MYRSIAYIGELVAILRTSLGRSRWESQCEAGYQPGVGYPIHPPGCDEQLVFFIKRCFNQGFQGLNYVCPEKMTSIAPCSHWISPELRRSAECRRVAVHQVCWGRSIVKWLAIVPEPMATWQFFGFAWWLSYGTNFWLGSQWAAVGCLGWHSKKEANNMHLWNRMAAVSLHLIMIAEHMYIYIYHVSYTIINPEHVQLAASLISPLRPFEGVWTKKKCGAHAPSVETTLLRQMKIRIQCGIYL